MSFRIVSYYTQNTIYEQIMINYLMPCLDIFSIPYFIYSRKDFGNWKKNVILQPEVIWMAMKTFPDCNIVWMDSDIMIRYYPELFNNIPERCDIGLYYRKYEDHWALSVPPGVDMPIPELQTSVIYFKNSPKMLEFVEEWMNRVAKDHSNHRRILEQLVDERLCDNLSYFMIPRSYCYTVVREDGVLPAVVMNDPIIAHFEASVQGKRDLYHLENFKGEADAT